MKFRARFFSGIHASSQEILIAVINNTLEGRSSTDELILEWPLEKTFLDPSSPHSPLLACKDFPDARIEWKETQSIHQALPQIKKSKSYLFEVGGRLWIPIAAGILSIVALLYFSIGPITQALSKKIPFSWEKKHLSDSSVFSLWKKCKITENSKKSLDEILKNIYPLFPSDNQISIQLELIKEKQPNAFTLPGGKILVTSGLLQKSEDPSWVQGILSHEIAHVELRHVTASLLRVTFLESLFNLLVASSSSALSPQTLLSLVERSYDRNSEREADARGVERLEKAGISPRGLVEFFKDDKDIPEFFSLLSTHPTNKERIENLSKITQQDHNLKLKAPNYNIQNWEDLRKSCLEENQN